MRSIIFILALVFFASPLFAQEAAIIPQPVSLEKSDGNFTISKKTVLLANDMDDRKTAKIFNEYLQQFYHFKLPVNIKATKDFIRLSTKKFIKAPDKDGYSLTVNKNEIVIDGDTYTGTFYGVQSLIQLLPVNAGKLSV